METKQFCKENKYKFEYQADKILLTSKLFDIIAGNPSINGYNLHKVGKRRTLFLFELHPDGDIQLIKQFKHHKKEYYC
ncbi:MAG: hypothetical protein PF487_13125 [Bacteroidales bacterium]|jgi:hypothetical protein|nr:hypothetical protein [Bacteroidales bacterium]